MAHSSLAAREALMQLQVGFFGRSCGIEVWGLGWVAWVVVLIGAAGGGGVGSDYREDAQVG